MSKITEHNRKRREDHSIPPFHVGFDSIGVRVNIMAGEAVVAVALPDMRHGIKNKQAEENAAFIVRAVNAYEEILKSLKEVTHGYEYAIRGMDVKGSRLGKLWVERAKAAIAKAESLNGSEAPGHKVEGK